MSKTQITLAWIILLAVVTTGCGVFHAPGADATTAACSESTDDTLSSETTVATTAPVITVPAELTALFNNTGITVQELIDLECSQLITVSSSGSGANINFYIYDNDQWILSEALSCNGYVGSNGVSDHKCEGDYATPKGLYPIGDAFYIHEAPQTGLGMFQITNDTYWVDDPDSAYYNRRVEGTADKDWRSAEHMIRYSTAYEYGFVIDYNPEAIPNAGSAIFFHVSDNATAGCIGTDKAFVLKYLALLNAACKPYILIA